MSDKKTTLSIEIRTIDAATAKIKAINDRLDAVSKPTRDFHKALSDFGEKSGLNNVISGFKGVGSAVEGMLAKLAVVGGVAGLAVHGLFGLVDEFDKLGDTAERVGVSVDFLASMRNAAERAGAPVEALDEGLTAFNQNIGQLRANTGRLYSFLEKVSPALLKQVKAAKSNEEAFDLMAAAIAKIPDPARRAALAQKAFGDSALAPLFAKGTKGIAELRAEYTKHAGSLEAAADAAGKTDDSMHKLHASLDGVKAGIVSGLAPALTVIIDKLSLWFDGHRAQIAEWAKDVGEKLPAAVQKVVEWLGKAYDKVTAFIDAVGGIENVAIGAAAILAGPLIGSVYGLTKSLLGAIGNAGKLAQAMGAIPSGAGALGAIGAAALPIAAGVMVSEATGGSLTNVARDKGYDADNLIDLFNQVASGSPRRDVSGPAHTAAGGGMRAAIAEAVAQAVEASKAKITIDITGAQRGTRVTADPTNTSDVDLSVGYMF